MTTMIARDIFIRADIDGTKALDKNEIRMMLKELQIYVKNKEITAIFERYDSDKNAKIDMQEFETFITELFRKEELIPIFEKYAPNFRDGEYDQPVMSLFELLKFFNDEQKQMVTLASLRKIHKSFEHINATKSCISFDVFGSLIFSLKNTIFNPNNSYQYQVRFYLASSSIHLGYDTTTNRLLH